MDKCILIASLLNFAGIKYSLGFDLKNKTKKKVEVACIHEVHSHHVDSPKKSSHKFAEEGGAQAGHMDKRSLVSRREKNDTLAKHEMVLTPPLKTLCSSHQFIP